MLRMSDGSVQMNLFHCFVGLNEGLKDYKVKSVSSRYSAVALTRDCSVWTVLIACIASAYLTNVGD